MGRLYSLAKFKYLSDDGTDYVVALSTEKGVSGSFSSASPTAKLSLPPQMVMRYVIGTDDSNNKVVLQIAQRSDPLFQAGGTFVYETTLFTVTSRIAEKWTGKL